MFYGDISRYAFQSDPDDTRVVFQQGRPITDADLNFQAAIQYDLHREFVKHLLGWHGTWDDFNVELENSGELKISGGDYFVDGMRCRIPKINLKPLPAAAIGAPNTRYIHYYLVAFEDSRASRRCSASDGIVERSLSRTCVGGCGR